jgi:hypothetical protein
MNFGVLCETERSRIYKYLQIYSSNCVSITNLQHACTSHVHSSHNIRQNTVSVGCIKENEVGVTSSTRGGM